MNIVHTHLHYLSNLICSPPERYLAVIIGVEESSADGEWWRVHDFCLFKYLHLMNRLESFQPTHNVLVLCMCVSISIKADGTAW